MVGWPLGPRPRPPWARVAGWSRPEGSTWRCGSHPLPQDSRVQWGLQAHAGQCLSLMGRRRAGTHPGIEKPDFILLGEDGTWGHRAPQGASRESPPSDPCGVSCFPSTCSWLSRKHQVTSALRCYHFGDCLDLYSGMVDMGDPDHGTEGTGGHVAHQICSTTRGTQSSVCSSVCHTRFSLSQTRCRIAQQGGAGRAWFESHSVAMTTWPARWLLRVLPRLTPGPSSP